MRKSSVPLLSSRSFVLCLPSAVRHNFFMPWFICPCYSVKTALPSLAQSAVENFLPVRRYEFYHRRTNARVVREVALFPGYIFIHTPWSGLTGLRKVPSVGDPLKLDGEPFPIPDNLVEDIMAKQRAYEYDDTKEGRAARGVSVSARYPKGAKVEILPPSPLAFCTGLVQSVDSRGAIEVLIEILGRKTPVKLRQSEVSLVS